MIKQKLKELTDEQRKQLMYAFENEFSQHVKLPDGKFLGVHLTGTSDDLLITETAGLWSFGILRKEQD